MVALTNNALPRLGLGMAALGRPGYINLNRSAIFDKDSSSSAASSQQKHQQQRSIDLMQNKANDVMKTLFEEAKTKNIIPWIDCARSYGLSEKFVGEYLKGNGITPDEVYVSSKWGYTYVADWKVQLDEGKPHEVKDHSVEVCIVYCVLLLCVAYLYNFSQPS